MEEFFENYTYTVQASGVLVTFFAVAWSIWLTHRSPVKIQASFAQSKSRADIIYKGPASELTITIKNKSPITVFLVTNQLYLSIPFSKKGKLHFHVNGISDEPLKLVKFDAKQITFCQSFFLNTCLNSWKEKTLFHFLADA